MLIYGVVEDLPEVAGPGVERPDDAGLLFEGDRLDEPYWDGDVYGVDEGRVGREVCFGDLEPHQPSGEITDPDDLGALHCPGSSM